MYIWSSSNKTEMEVEIERAVEQVEKSIDDAKQRRQKAEVERSVETKGDKKG